MNKRQTRHVRRRTIFIYCEGKTDALFVQHLKGLYLQRGTKQINIKRGMGGGDGLKFISEVKKEARFIEYDEKYIVLDSNGKTKEKREDLETSAQEEKIQLIWQQPCLEGVFLRILKDKNFITTKSSQHCKSTFKDSYLTSNTQSLTTLVLERIFSKIILDKKRQQLPELNQLIQLMEE